MHDYRHDSLHKIYESVHGRLDHVDDDLYALWKARGQHIEEYLSEFGGTAVLAFAVVGVVAVMFAASSPMGHIVPSQSLRLFFAGLLIGSSGWLVAVSPPGKLSGAHLNPAVSIGFWILGKMYPRDVVGYVVAQMLGGLIGASLAAFLFGPLAAQTGKAVLAPGPHVSESLCLWSEFGASLVMMAVIYYCVSHPKLAPYTPAFVTLFAGILVCLDGHVSGAGMNPARWFGPAWLTHTWRFAWLYTGAPIVAAVIAAAVRRYSPARMPKTAKLMHDVAYRSIFKHDALPTTPLH